MKKKQAVAFLLSTTMAVGGAVQAFGASSDISGHWAQATITKWQDAGRIGGYEDGTFKPDRTITRAEFVRLLNSATSTSFTSSASVNFSDVKESDWFYADVAKAVGAKITSGFEDGTFRPSETVTRMQAAVFICNAKGLAANEAGANLLTDAAQIPAWAKGAVGAVISAGYMSGYPDGSFGGAKGMTRAEAVSTLDRVLGGGVTTPAPDNQGVSTPDTNQDTTIADAKQEGNMVWRSGGGGGGSSSKGSSDKDKEDEDKIVKEDITINSQREANKFEGKTIQGDATINLNSNLDLEDVKFEGNVTVNSGTVAAAYIGNDTAVAAANTTKWTILLVGTTSFDGNVTVTSDKTDAPFVEIKTLSKKAISNFIAETAARIVGFTTTKVQASAPVQIADGSVTTIAAETGAEITVESDAEVTTIDITGNAEAKVTVQGGATVSTVNISDNASAEVVLEDKAEITNVEVSDTATATVDIAADAVVGKYNSTSTASGSKITGEGTVTNGITVVEGTTDVDETVNGEVTETEKPTVTSISVAPETATVAVGATTKLTATVEGSGTGYEAVKWTTSDETIATVTEDGTVTGVKAGEATITVTSTVDNTKTATATITVTENTASDTYTIKATGATGTDGKIKLNDEITLSLVETGAPETVTWTATWDDTDKTTITVTNNTFTIANIPEGATKLTITGTAADATITPLELIVDAGEVAAVTNITIDPTSAALLRGKTTEFTAKVEVTGDAATTVNWTVTKGDAAEDVTTDTEIVTTNGNTLTFTMPADAVDTDTYTVTATSTVDEEKTVEATVTVTKEATAEDITKVIAELANVTVDTANAVAWADRADKDKVGAAIKKAAEAAIPEITGLTDTEGWTVDVDATVAAEGLNAGENSVSTLFTLKKGGEVVTGGTSNEITAQNITVNVAKVTAIKVTAEGFAEGQEATIALGSTGGLQLNAEITPANACQEVEWSVDGEGIANVDETGKLTLGNGASAGVYITVTATAKDGSDQRTTFKVKVVEAAPTVAVTGITVVGADGATEVAAGSTLTMEATVTPDNATEKGVTWTATDASDQEIEGVTISEAGVLTVGADVVANTEIKVTATTKEAGSSVKGEATITVTEAAPTVAVTGITVAGADGATEVAAGSTLTMEATVTPDNATEKGVTWTATDASDQEIEGVTISEAGVLTVGADVVANTEIKVTATTKEAGSSVKGEATITVTTA